MIYVNYVWLTGEYDAANVEVMLIYSKNLQNVVQCTNCRTMYRAR